MAAPLATGLGSLPLEEFARVRDAGPKGPDVRSPAVSEAGLKEGPGPVAKAGLVAVVMSKVGV